MTSFLRTMSVRVFVTLPTIKAIEVLEEDPADTNAIIHVTC